MDHKSIKIYMKFMRRVRRDLTGIERINIQISTVGAGLLLVDYFYPLNML